MTSFSLAVDHLDHIIRQGMTRYQTPAVAVAWTDREKLLHTATWGYANVEEKTPLTEEHLFNFGSIGKSFTCIALLKTHENGMLDLHAPVTQYLPWFDIKTQYRPISIHDLMTHSSGLPQGTDRETEALGEVWNLRYNHTGFPPGEAFYYSNSAYKTLGLVLEKIYSQLYPEIIQSLILDPLKMDQTEPALTYAIQPRFAKAYKPRYDDRPNRLDADLVPVPWIESATADGCISSNAADLASFTRMLLNRGVGPADRIFSEESFEKMIQPYQQRGEERAYGYGMMMWEEDGCRIIGHSGSIPGYLAFMRMDLDNGLGAVMLMAEPALEGASEIAFQTLRAAAAGAQLPVNPFERDILAVENHEDYTGRYAGEVRSFTIHSDEDRLIMAYGGTQVHLEPRGKDAFLVWHPDFDRFLLKFMRQDGAETPVVEAFYGGEWFRGERFSGETDFEAPVELQPYPGHYRCHNPWSTNFRIVTRRGALVLIHPGGREAQLEPIDSGEYLIRYEGETVHVERLSFEGLVDGKAVIARYSGEAYYRFFTP